MARIPRQAVGFFGCLTALLCRLEIDEPPLLPKWKKFWSTSLIPVEPEPTPKNTKPSAKTTASSTKAHFACTAQTLEEQLLLPLADGFVVRSWPLR